MTLQAKNYIAIGFIILALAVALGAFGAHALKKTLTPHYLEVFQTANRYHFIHGLGMIITIYILKDLTTVGQLKTIFLFFFIGIILFSASLYILSIADMIGMSQLKFMGAITPIGGVLFILAWSYSALLLFGSQ